MSSPGESGIQARRTRTGGAREEQTESDGEVEDISIEQGLESGRYWMMGGYVWRWFLVPQDRCGGEVILESDDKVACGERRAKKGQLVEDAADGRDVEYKPCKQCSAELGEDGTNRFWMKWGPHLQASQLLEEHWFMVRRGTTDEIDRLELMAPAKQLSLMCPYEYRHWYPGWPTLEEWGGGVVDWRDEWDEDCNESMNQELWLTASQEAMKDHRALAEIGDQ